MVEFNRRDERPIFEMHILVARQVSAEQPVEEFHPFQGWKGAEAVDDFDQPLRAGIIFRVTARAAQLREIFDRQLAPARAIETADKI